MLQTVQRHEVYSAAYGTVHHKKTLKSFEIRVEHSPGFGLRSVAILPKCAENDVEQYSLTPQTLDMENLEPCTQQESDGRIILHVADAARQGHHNIRWLQFNFFFFGGGADVFFK